MVSINRQSFKSKNNLNVILENIYLEDRVNAVKIAAKSRNINVSTRKPTEKKNRKRKRPSLVNDTELLEQSKENGPPEKHRDLRPAKRARKRGKALIHTTVEVEYKGKNEEGKLTYLGWLTGTITAYNSRQGYLVQFKNQNDCSGNETGEWTDWIPSVNSLSSDVRISSVNITHIVNTMRFFNFKSGEPSSL